MFLNWISFHFSALQCGCHLYEEVCLQFSLYRASCFCDFYVFFLAADSLFLIPLVLATCWVSLQGPLNPTESDQPWLLLAQELILFPMSSASSRLSWILLFKRERLWALFPLHTLSLCSFSFPLKLLSWYINVGWNLWISSHVLT